MAELKEHFEEDASTDPFAPENIGVVNFITMSRVYDVLMALLTETNPDTARNLLETHANGGLMGSMPAFNGNFITDDVNTPESPA